ncbi:BamA/TamA family outer membrane protein [Olivibacter sp. SDN3]|uniref:BamA/TamA family outer membrane protein n=1 Tax=Olivibacter sp. SDN3 TaxID=2764720 RepID=UPI0016514E7C|nr:BamA/TamA family outer membrane protein [Olivibacter sp. SDN3]QNL51032.1 BamA/TamA family outer membrane protein [Olivibacter sp. SDN3]
MKKSTYTTVIQQIIRYVLFLHFLIPSTHAQQLKENWVKRYVNSIINDTTHAEQATLTIYPTFATSPETGIELGASIMKLFYAEGDTLNRLSELQAFTFFTFKGQYGLVLENAIYGDQDKWFFLGETKIQQFPLLYYGIGPNTPKHHPASVNSFNILFRQRVLRKISRNLFLGPEVDYQLISGVRFDQPSEGDPYPIPAGGEGTSNLGMGMALVYDDRHNVLNVRKGRFGEVAYLRNFDGFASDYNFGTLNVEFRSFHPIGKRDVLAWQIKGNFLQGEVPFNQLAQLGGDRLMRGYYLGRFRDKHAIAAQVEYRILPFAFSKRLGASVFAAAGAVAPHFNAFEARNIKGTAGVGLRYLLFPKKDIYIRFDIGFTKEGANFYIFNGEAF